METTWEIVGEDGQFLVVEYTRGDKTIRLQVLPTPGVDIGEVIKAHAPSIAQFEGLSPPDHSHLIGQTGSTAEVEALPA